MKHVATMAVVLAVLGLCAQPASYVNTVRIAAFPAGATYAWQTKIERSTDLTNWQDVLTLPYTTNAIVFQDTNAPAVAFYRVGIF